jgi:hypothetical protein
MTLQIHKPKTVAELRAILDARAPYAAAIKAAMMRGDIDACDKARGKQMNRFNRDYALVRQDGSVIWESHDVARLYLIRAELADEGIESRVVKSDLPRSRSA